MAQTDTTYAVAIIGSGIGGSTLGAILARQGLQVIIFEAGVHPKFAVGESMILETSETLRAMAELYDVPELAYFSSENYKLWSVYSVLWLMGAYLEYVKLMSARGLAKSRADYFAQIAGLRLVGGGFCEFFTIAERVDTLIEAVDPSDEPAVDRAVAEIRALYAAVPWMPLAFQHLLKGKNHLPKHKLRLSLFDREVGFLGSGAYRQHFFGDVSMCDVAQFYVVDSIKYSTPALRVQKRRDYRRKLAMR